MPLRGAGGLITVMTTPLLYIDCDIPDGMTLHEWRRSQCAHLAARRPLWRRFLRR